MAINHTYTSQETKKQLNDVTQASIHANPCVVTVALHKLNYMLALAVVTGNQL